MLELFPHSTRADDGELIVAMEDPTDAEAVQAIGAVTGWKVRAVLAVRNDLRRVIHSMYGPAAGDEPRELLRIVRFDLPKDSEYRAVPTDLEVELVKKEK